MDRAKSKKIRNIRIIATNIFMCLSVIAIVFVLMLVAMGFTFNESGKLEQAGLIQLTSTPSDASITIDGESQFGKTEFSKMLSSGVHQISIAKPGFDTWRKDLKIDAGLLTRVEWIRLFPKKSKVSEAKQFNDLRLASFSPNRRKLIVIEKDSNKLFVVDIQDDNAKTTELALNDCLSTTAAKAVDGTISIVAWNDSNSRFIAKWTNGEDTSWHLVDIEHSENSTNLSKKFNLTFDSILTSNDSASKLWALENGNLRLIDADNFTISSSIASNIEKIAHNRDVITFVHIENGARQLSLYRDGEKGYSTIAKLNKTTEDTTIKLAMGTYWNDEWLTYSTDKKIYILKGKYPSYGKNESNKFKTILERELNYAPQLLSVNANRRVAVYMGENNMTSYDIETDDCYDTQLTNSPTNINWLDDYLIWQNVDNAAIVRDFDGDNRRTVVSNINNPFPIAISQNNKWLYYFDMAEKETATDADKTTPSDSDPVNTTKTALKYTLKRKSLQP